MSAHGKVVLDPTGIYTPPDDVDIIATERQWLEYVGRSSRMCWVKGEGLTRWTREWLRQLGETSLILEEKRFPRARLQAFLKNVPVPQEWDDKLLLEWVDKLDSYNSDSPVPYLLSELVPTAPTLWFEPPSIQHLACFLCLDIQPELRPFVVLWAEELVERCEEDWVSFYRTTDHIAVLRAWIGLDENVKRPADIFPLEIPASLTREFDAIWTTKIVETSGGVIDTLNCSKQCGMGRIAEAAVSVLRSRQSWITAARIRKLVPHLQSHLIQQIHALIPPKTPVPLSKAASAAEALSWATKEYLPFRKWQVLHEPTTPSRDTTESLADSFVMWILSAYPSLKLDSVTESVLNYSVTSKVVKISGEAPVLWAVIDGLGWIEHAELVRSLCGSHGFTLHEAIEPKISILPTKTEFAKWSLYAQLLPNHPSWEPDASKGFRNIPRSERYTDAPSRREALVNDLRSDKHQIYCWDTTEYDSLFHNDTSWNHLIEVAVPNKLSWIAEEISYFASQYPNPSRLQIVLCSDHGQLIGEHAQLEGLPQGFEFGGRLAYGRVPDARFVTLEADRFGIQNDISVVRGSGCIQSFLASQTGGIVGVHGGLYPEEVIVAVSVLQYGVERHRITVVCRGKGKAQEPGAIEVEITNPNGVPLTDAVIYVSEVAELAGGYSLEVAVTPYGREVASLQVKQWPELPVGKNDNRLWLTGSLEFKFGGVENGRAAISKESSIEITQMFRSGLDIDEFI